MATKIITLSEASKLDAWKNRLYVPLEKMIRLHIILLEYLSAD